MSITTDKKKTIKPTVIPDNIPLAEEIPLEDGGKEKEIPLEKKIENSLIKANITDKVIAELKEKFGNVRLKNIEDKEGFLECKDASKSIRKVEILAEKICEAGRSDAVKEQRLWISKQKELLAKTAVIKDPIDAEIKKFEDEVERKELIEHKRKEEIYINRQATLLKMGATYDNGSFVLNHISYEVELIKAADEEQWNDTILPKYKKVYEELEAIKVEEENKRKAELEQQRKEREEFEAKQKEFQKQQELFAQQQAQLQAQQDEANRKERLAQEQKEDEERKKVKEKLQDRADQLTALGMRFSFNFDAYVFEDVNVDNKTEICLLDDKEWNELVEKITPVIEQRKQAIEEQRLAEIEKSKQDAIDKALEEAAFQRKQAEEIRLRDLEVAKDKEKYADVVAYLKKTPIHAMTSNIYKSKMSAINDFIQDL